MLRKSAIWFGLTLALAGAAGASEPEARLSAKPTCFTAAETREEIKARRLIEPFAALKSTQTQFKGEALSAKLCRIGDQFVYEISLLHRDGRYVHVWLNAATGKLVELRRAHEAAPRETPAKP